MAHYKIVVYVPVAHVEPLKQAMFSAGAGQQGHYDQCCWQVLGDGQFRPLANSQPFIGDANTGTVEQVPEYRVEMICERSILADVISALVKTHPYEEPAFDIIHTISSNELDVVS